jgi:hypothetical protein
LIVWLSILVSFLPPLLMFLAVGTERLETTRLARSFHRAGSDGRVGMTKGAPDLR